MKKLQVFSAVRGQVLDAGRPVSGLEIVQRWQWLSVDDGEARTTTDGEGRFAFPEVSVRRLRAPKDVLILQEIVAQHRGAKVTIWEHTRQSLAADAELGVPTIELEAHLDRPVQEVKVPVGPDARSVISGVATLRHPYVEQWDRTCALVRPDDVGRALQRFLDTPVGRAGLARFFPQVGHERWTVARIDAVRDVRLSEGALHTDAEAGHFAAKGEARFVGFTVHAQVALTLETGEELTVGFFAWTVYLPIDAAGVPAGEARIPDVWEIDARPFVRARVQAALDRDRLAALVLARLKVEPGAAFLEAFDAPPGIDAVTLEHTEVDGQKDDWATVKVRGVVDVRRGRVAARHRFGGHLAIQLASLGGAYRLATLVTPLFRVTRFKVSLSTDKAVYAPGEKVILTFRVENQMPTPQRFLQWHTPFEGFLNDFLALTHESGEKAAYMGPLVSRAPPGPDDYLALGPLAHASSEIDVTECYPVTTKGVWVLGYKALGDGIEAGETRFEVR